ncbi:MAG: NBR1-Ig-like domain-containing protein [Patescibacteria group bacterium]|nr:NBR1-Ig-like domain-containing protein [Patescibacteria group bacterium]
MAFKRTIFFSLAMVFALFFGAEKVLAIDFTPPPFKDLTYVGAYAGQSVPDPITIQAGQTKEVTIKIKNIGKATWYATGANYVSAYTVNKNYRASAFASANWLGKDHPAKISATAKPGQIAEIKIKFTAPSKTGNYREDFYLAAENKTWIKSSYFYIKFKVIPATVVTPAADESAEGNSAAGTNDQAEEVSKEYQANLLAFSARSVSAPGGDQINFKVRYINNGTLIWNNYLWQEAGSSPQGDVSIAEVTRVALADQSWINEKKIFEKTETITPGGVTEINFNFRAPAKQGAYIARFQLTANGHTLDGGTLELPVTVTADAPIGYTEPVFNTGPRALIAEPKIRVGLYKTDDPVKFQSPFEYQIYVGEILKGFLPANELAEVKYFDGLYTFTAASLSFVVRDPVRFVPVEAGGYFTLPGYSRLVSWKGSKNFNAYRNVMEYKFSTKSALPWVVNELLLDEYVAGIAETSNGAAMEYIKALLVAARSYAYYQINNGTPADQRTYDVVATTADQLYLGYNSEVLMPRVVQAARATYGEMVLYSNTPVITPYFGHSDGRTRTWVQVWGGTDKPWLQSVECTYDAGQSMFGHGVGMSAQDAANRADKDAWTYDQLLRYYYTGTEVARVY